MSVSVVRPALAHCFYRRCAFYRFWPSGRCFCTDHSPRLNSTIPPSPPRSQKSSSSDRALTACRCGNAPSASGNAKMDVTRMRLRFMGNTIRGRAFSQSVFWSRTSINGGRTMMGVALKTRDAAVSATASVAAFFDLPTLSTSLPDFSRSAIWDAVWEGKISIPLRISSPRMRKTLRAVALATAAKGTRRVRIVRVLGEMFLRRGTTALRPRATPQDALTAAR